MRVIHIIEISGKLLWADSEGVNTAGGPIGVDQGLIEAGRTLRPVAEKAFGIGKRAKVRIKRPVFLVKDKDILDLLPNQRD